MLVRHACRGPDAQALGRTPAVPQARIDAAEREEGLGRRKSAAERSASAAPR